MAQFSPKIDLPSGAAAQAVDQVSVQRVAARIQGNWVQAEVSLLF